MSVKLSEATGGQAALIGFVTLANQHKGAACAEIVKQALAHDKIYVFGELLGHENVQALESTHKPLHDLLKIFAYGTYTDYKAQQDELPELSNLETTKLKQLSLVSLAANSSVLEYKQMMNELSLDTPRALEDLILKTVFAGLVEGQLDQQKGVFEVQFAMGRDIGPNDVDIMLAKLKDWLEHSTTLKEELKTHQTRANAKVVSDSKLEEVITNKRAALIKEVNNDKHSKRHIGAMSGLGGDSKRGGSRGHPGAMGVGAMKFPRMGHR